MWILVLYLGVVLLVMFSAAALCGFVPARERRARSAATFSMAATGFTLMALQIFLLLAFQSIFGYVYHQLAILIALCMAGIALGSWLGLRRIRRDEHSACRAVALTQLLLALSAPVLMVLVSCFAKVSGAAATWLAAQCVFPALAALSGILGGFQFPMATAIYLHDGSGRRALGTLYAIDLLGGCAGALGTQRLSHSGLWILEDGMALRGGESGAGSDGRTGEVPTFQ